MKILQELAAMKVETNAAQSSVDGVGGELIPDSVLSKQVLELVPAQSSLLPFLPSDQNKIEGGTLNNVHKISEIGEIPKFEKGEGEQTSGFTTAAANNASVVTNDVTITQKRLELTIDITQKLKKYSIIDLETWIKGKLAESVANTIDDLMLNGDTDETANTNINKIDGTPAGTERYTLENGIRQRGLIGNTGVDIGTLEWADYLAMLAQMGVYANDPSQLLWLLNPQTYITSMGLTEFKDASQNGKESVIHDGSKALTNILGADLLSMRDYAKADDTGKISVTAGNNSKGAMSLLWTPGIAYGFGDEFKLKIFDYGSRGVKLNAWFDFGFTVLDPSDVGVTDAQTVSSGYNATVL